jgi:hypothetical protein
MWLNPLPAESSIGATAGAVLGTILATHPYFSVSNWLEVYLALAYTVLIILFGISAHFYCAAHLLQRTMIQKIFLLCCALLLVAIFVNPKEAGLDEETAIRFLPHEVNLLVGGTLLVWLAALRILTEVKRRTGETK